MDTLTWRGLLRWAAVAALVVYVLILAMARQVIPPILVIGVLILVGYLVMRRRPKGGAITLLVGMVVYFVTNTLFSLGDLGQPASFPSFAITTAAFVVGVVGVVAAIATLRADGPSAKARTLTRVSAAAIVLFLVVNVVGTLTFDDAKARPGDLRLVAKVTAWNTKTLTASAGRITFYVRNSDPVLHNLDVKGVGKVEVPAGHSVRKTFTIAAGTYKFVCDYHQDDMKGTLTVT